MNGAGKKVWGYDKTNDVWLPVQVDANGKLIVDMSAINLDDLADIDLTGIADGYVLYWDAATSLWKVKAESIFTCGDLASCDLNDLGDVNIPAPATLDFIYWDDTAGKWVNISYANLLASIQGDTSLDDLADVTIAGLVDGHFLSYSSGLGYWQNRLLAGADIPNLDAAKITSGILNPARVGPKIQDADGDTWIDVEKNADEDKIRMGVKNVEAFVLHDDGILDLPKQSQARAYLDNANGQEIDTSTWTKVLLESTSFDTQNEFDVTTNHRYVATKAGFYLVTALLKMRGDQIVANQLVSLRISHSGTVTSSSIFHTSLADKWVGVPCIALLNLAANDYVELEAFHTMGNTKWIQGAEHQTHMCVSKLS